MDEKVVLITGAGTGIGLASCKVFLARGWRVVAHHFEEEPDFATIKNDKYLTPVYSNFLDEQAGEEVLSFLGGQRVDSLINCAGLPDLTTTKENRTKAAKDVFYVNVILPSLLCEAVMVQMKKRKSGTIVNVSSVGVKFGSNANNIFYGASKSAIEAVTRTFAREAADFNIRVNCIAPGPIQTDLINGVSEKQINKIISQQMQKKMFKQDDVCDLVEVLLDDKSKSLTGEVLNIGGA